MWLLFCTPKCAYNLDLDKLPEQFKGAGIEIVATHHIYMNLVDPSWTIDKCDTVVYLVKKEEFESNNLLKLIP